MLEALIEPIFLGDSVESDASVERLDEEDRLTIDKCILPVITWLIFSHSKYQEASRYTSKEDRIRISTELADSIDRKS